MAEKVNANYAINDPRTYSPDVARVLSLVVLRQALKQAPDEEPGRIFSLKWLFLFLKLYLQLFQASPTRKRSQSYAARYHFCVRSSTATMLASRRASSRFVSVLP